MSDSVHYIIGRSIFDFNCFRANQNLYWVKYLYKRISLQEIIGTSYVDDEKVSTMHCQWQPLNGFSGIFQITFHYFVEMTFERSFASVDVFLAQIETFFVGEMPSIGILHICNDTFDWTTHATHRRLTLRWRTDVSSRVTGITDCAVMKSRNGSLTHAFQNILKNPDYKKNAPMTY